MGKLTSAPARLGRAPDRIAYAPKVALPFYKSKPWRDLVARVIALRGKRCERPGCQHGGRIYADHIVELRDGGAALDETNIELLCAAHHGEKTAMKQRERVGLR